MTHAQEPPVGVLHAPDLTEAVERLGLSVVGGGLPDLRSSVNAIGKHLNTAGLIPLLALGTPERGKAEWLTKAAANGASVTVLAGPDGIQVPGASVVALPAGLDDVLAAVGVDPRPGAEALTVEVDGTVTQRSAAPAMPDFDDLFDGEDHVGSEPKLDPAPPDPATAPDPMDDVWGDMAAPGPEPIATPAEPAPPPPVQVERQEPTPAPSAPMPFPVPVQPSHPPAPDPYASGPSPVAPAPARPALPERQRVTQMGPDGTVYVLNEAGTGWDVLKEPQPPPLPPLPGAEPSDPAGTAGFIGEEDSQAPVRRMHGEKAPTAWIFSPKGGVGKTTTTLQVAQRAAKHGGMRVAMIDMNRGQGGTRVLMRLMRANLPTVLDYATREDLRPQNVLIHPDVLNEGRPAQFDGIDFSAVFAPPGTVDDASFRRVTAQAYSEVIEYARTVSDLVVIDTQTLDSVDMTGLIDGVFQPSMQSGGWGIALTDTGAEGATFLVERLSKFARAGVDQSRVLLAVTRVDPQVAAMADSMLSRYASMATPLGPILFDNSVKQSLSNGKFAEDHEAVVAVLDDALLRITGNPAFRAENRPAPGKKRRGLFGRKAK